MSLLKELNDCWEDSGSPFLITDDGELSINELYYDQRVEAIPSGAVVLLEGDFNARSLSTLISLIDKKCIVAPVTHQTKQQHEYFASAISAEYVISESQCDKQASSKSTPHDSIQHLRACKHAGLVLFSSGTTGQPKAILHDFEQFLIRFRTPRPSLKTLAFLLFDHIGGLNTIFHSLFNGGTVVSLKDRTVRNVLATIETHDVELLPTTPTFLRMLLLSGDIGRLNLTALKLITYGTERMDQPTLDAICTHLPEIDVRQTYGMSELGILRVKSRARDSLFMSVGGEGVETKIVDGSLHIRNLYRMLGYLNAPSPFDADGWYNTRDLVDQDGDFIRVVGRDSDQLNVGGLKFMPREVEEVVLSYTGTVITAATLRGVSNPISGQHGELTIEVEDPDFNIDELKRFLRAKLPNHMMPLKIRRDAVSVNHRFKKSG